MSAEFLTPEQRAELELQEVEDCAVRQQPIIEPTKDERRNGWTEETLTDYLASRTAGQSVNIDINSAHRRLARRPDMQNHRYSPHRWRG